MKLSKPKKLGLFQPARGLAAVALLCLCFGVARAADDHNHDSHADAADNQALRDTAAQKIEWRHRDFPRIKAPVHVKLLGFNDFHGHISAGTQVAGRPVGGAAVFASYLRAAQRGAAQSGIEDRTFIVHAGDAVGASPLSSALLHDEPTIGGAAIDTAATYSVTVNSFLATGGDKFTVLNGGVNRVGGPLDIDALVGYMKSLPQPIAPPPTGSRIVRLN